MAVDRIRIVVIGAGVSGTAALVALVRDLEARPHAEAEALAARLFVTVVERTGDFGPGLPYGRAAAPFHLLNMTSDTMSLLPDDTADFMDWLAERDGAAADFATRHRYGEYTRERFADAVRRARRLGARVLTVADEAVGVEEPYEGEELPGGESYEGRSGGVVTPHGGERPYGGGVLPREPDAGTAPCEPCLAGGSARRDRPLIVRLACGSRLIADRLLVATGHWQPPLPRDCAALDARLRSSGEGGLFRPWPAASLAQVAHSGQTVVMLGTSLTALDACFAIADAAGRFVERDGRVDYLPEEDTRIVACSRRGLLPQVRVAQCDLQLPRNPYLVCEPVAELGEESGQLTAASVERRFRAASAWLAERLGGAAGPADDDPAAAFAASLAAADRKDPAVFARQELARDFFAPMLWMYRRMPSAQRRLLWSQFLTGLLVEGAPLPPEAGRRLDALLRSGMLRIRGGAGRLVPGDKTFLLTFRTAAEPLEAGYVVHATGRGIDVGPGAEFAGAAVDAGVLVPDPAGGVRVEPDTWFALAGDGTVVDRVAVVGQLAMGSHIGYSAAASCVKRAANVARTWLAGIAGGPAPALGPTPVPPQTTSTPHSVRSAQ